MCAFVVDGKVFTLISKDELWAKEAGKYILSKGRRESYLLLEVMGKSARHGHGSNKWVAPPGVKDKGGPDPRLFGPSMQQEKKDE
jgi:hypothetical protein